ncbi:TOX high mobility group box family member 4-like isoform X2 [Cydia fagiglandana]|uniref:TOX high mobility group box family member 4-like isoform X2 n=1 Tax=Cydia fagiglandana TaxID=1458189 RepID=UPI002FEDEF4A
MNSEEATENSRFNNYGNETSTLHDFTIYLILSVLTILLVVLLAIITRLFQIGQKTRTPPQRRMYVGSRVRQSLSQAEPTIYVSPNNLPPPPKYECLAPPSYEEVVGIHYPQYQNQPITQPITVAMAQNTQPSQNVTDAPPAPTVITVTSERTSVQVAASSS